MKMGSWEEEETDVQDKNSRIRDMGKLSIINTRRSRSFQRVVEEAGMGMSIVEGMERYNVSSFEMTYSSNMTSQIAGRSVCSTVSKNKTTWSFSSPSWTS